MCLALPTTAIVAGRRHPGLQCVTANREFLHHHKSIRVETIGEMRRDDVRDEVSRGSIELPPLPDIVGVVSFARAIPVDVIISIDTNTKAKTKAEFPRPRFPRKRHQERGVRTLILLKAP